MKTLMYLGIVIAMLGCNAFGLGIAVLIYNTTIAPATYRNVSYTAEQVGNTYQIKNGNLHALHYRIDPQGRDIEISIIDCKSRYSINGINAEKLEGLESQGRCDPAYRYVGTIRDELQIEPENRKQADEYIQLLATSDEYFEFFHRAKPMSIGHTILIYIYFIVMGAIAFFLNLFVLALMGVHWADALLVRITGIT